MRKFIAILLPLLVSFTSFSEPIHKDSRSVRPEETNPFETFQTCKDYIEKTVSKLNCKIPPVVYGPGLTLKKSMEYFVQFYAARNGVSYDQLNTLANLTQTPDGKKALVYFFTGLKCAGLPGDPINRKNWTTYLPQCPSTVPKSPPWVKDNKWGTANYHPGAYRCLRLGASRPAECGPRETIWQCMGKEWFKGLNPRLAEILIDKTPSQQCCYDSERQLITEGPAAGTPDIVFRSHSVEEAAEQHFLKLEENSRDLKLEDLEKELAKQKRSAHEIKESLAHHIIDARIIDACFPGWPGKDNENVRIYHSLGWTPSK